MRSESFLGLVRRIASTSASALPILAMAAMFVLGTAGTAVAQSKKGFSFVAYGDSRSMMYLPYTKADTAIIHSSLVQIFSLILGERVAAEIVQKDVKLSFDPKTGALATVEMPFLTKSEITRLTFQDGWVTEASVEDIKLAPGVRTVMYRSLRRFNAVFLEQYRMPPSALRRRRKPRLESAGSDMLRLTLSYRPPLAWQQLLHSLAGDAIPQVEAIGVGRYSRTVTLRDCTGMFTASHGHGHVDVDVLSRFCCRLFSWN